MSDEAGAPNEGDPKDASPETEAETKKKDADAGSAGESADSGATDAPADASDDAAKSADAEKTDADAEKAEAARAAVEEQGESHAVVPVRGSPANPALPRLHEQPTIQVDRVHLLQCARRGSCDML